jgi:hypothetical protein
MEFSFSDERLDCRADFCFSKMLMSPSLSFPQLFNEQKDLQAFYRFINNDHVKTDDIKDAIFSNTKSRLGEVSEALAIHDTTHVSPLAKAPNIEEFKTSKGFFAHVSLIVDSNNLKKIYGPAGLHLWSRKKRKTKEPTGEFVRWIKQVNQVEADFSDFDLIHVMDREGDACSIWSEMFKEGRRFVIRARSTNRRVMEEGDPSLLIDVMKNEPPIAERKVTLSKRHTVLPHARHSNRKERETLLKISAKEMHVCLISPTGAKLKETIALNVIYVFEEPRRSQSNEDSVEWLLLTTESIKTEKQVLRVVDIYKARWVIEEFFKGLKTGCRLEGRLLSEADSWHKIFTLYLPVAAQLLNLRLSEENYPTREFTKVQMKILKLLAKEQSKKIETNKQALYQLANLGGHIKSSGPPGWITLFRGYQELLNMERGYLLMRSEKM